MEDNNTKNNSVVEIIKKTDELTIDDILPEEVTVENVLLLKNRIRKAGDVFLKQKNELKGMQEYVSFLKDQYLESDGFYGNVNKIEQEVQQTQKALEIKHPNLRFTKEDLCTIHSIVKENNLSLTSKDIWIYESQGKNIIAVSIYAYRKIASAFKDHHYGIDYLFSIKDADGKIGWTDVVENPMSIISCKATMNHIDPMGRELKTNITMQVADYAKVGRDGKPVSTWKNYRLTMIQKVAEAQVLRSKFPSLGGTVTFEEIGDIQDADKKNISSTVIDTSDSNS